MRFGNFLFTESRRPEDDTARIAETMAMAKLSEALGMDALWLAEHHFDGNCAYVDPVTFAAALATATERVKIGFAVIQASLHHPMRLAEQLSLIDHLSKGRLMVGLGRGTNLNIYDYQGYDIDHTEAQARYLEIYDIIMKAWTTEGQVEHQGKFWNLKLPMFRPRTYTRPHPQIVHAASGEASMVEFARKGLPFLMSVQTNDVTAQRIALYRKTMRDSGFSEEAIERNVEQCWVWRNVFVAETDAEAERIGVPAFQEMTDHRASMRRRIYAEQGVAMRVDASGPGNPATSGHAKALVYGSPATVAEKMSELAETGIGGVIMAMRLGPLSYDGFVESANLFMKKVAPQVKRKVYA